MNRNEILGSCIIEELYRLGVRNFFVAPGARSAPLVNGLYLLVEEKQDPKVKIITHFDERGLAFMALGRSRVSSMPSVVITTSGTAVANLLPAVIEARQSVVPLILLTADRPPEVISSQSNQAIDQNNIFSKYVEDFYDIPCFDSPEVFNHTLTAVDNAYYRAIKDDSPVHINVRFREPVVGGKNAIKVEEVSSFNVWKKSLLPYTTYKSGKVANDEKDILDTCNSIIKAKSGAIVIGAGLHSEELGLIKKISIMLRFPIFACGYSGARNLAAEDQKLILENPTLVAKVLRGKGNVFYPSIVLKFGMPTVNRDINEIQEQWRNKGSRIIFFGKNSNRIDPIACNSEVFTCLSKVFLESCYSLIKKNVKQHTSYSDEVSLVLEFDKKIQGKKLKVLDSFSEFAAIEKIVQNIPESSKLFLGNSLTIRWFDWYLNKSSLKKGVELFANRGASGIDGNIATIAGLASKQGSLVTGILGDNATFYDINSLVMLRNVESRVVLVVIGNGGGQIFKYLPGLIPEKKAEVLYTTPANINLGKVVAGFGLNYYKVSSFAELQDSYINAISSPTNSIIEVELINGDTRKLHNEFLANILSSTSE